VKLSPLLILVGLLCWFLFVLGTAAGFIAGSSALLLSVPLMALKPEWAKRLQRYAGNNVHASDCSAAAFLGFAGDKTISKECGLNLASGDPCDFCTYLCKALATVERRHCEKEAEK
jgi:hypothetical protein